MQSALFATNGIQKHQAGATALTLRKNQMPTIIQPSWLNR
jgi:hypothetical protein